MKLMTTAALLGAGMLALTATTASAEIVCNEDGDCWHVKERHKYPADVKLRVYPDDWKWRESETHYRWREHPGRGYWRSGVWIDF